MKITESKLRRIIKQVLIEINSPQQARAAMAVSKAYRDEGDFEEAFAKAFPEVQKEKRKGINLRKRKGINLRKGHDKLTQKRLISKLKKDLKLEDDIIPERELSFSKSFGKEMKSKETVMIKYDVALLGAEKDESKTNSFIGPLTGKSSFLIRYEGNVFSVKIKYKYPEDRTQHLDDMTKKLRDRGLKRVYISNASDL